MRIACYQCSASHVVSEESLEAGVVRLTCTQCQARLFVDQSGGVHASEDDIEQTSTAVAVVSAPAPADPSDAYATIPLPSLGELGLTAASFGGRPAPDAPSPGGVTASAATRGAPLPLPPPPPPPAVVSPGALSPSGTAGGSLPPSAVRLPEADLDGDDELATAPSRFSAETTSGGGRASQATVPPSQRGTSLRGTGARLQRYTVSVPVPPVTKPGWGVFAGLAVVGVVLGAALSSGSSSEAPFDRDAAREAISEATRKAIACFDDGVPDINGTIQLVFNTDGEVEHFEAEGPLEQNPRLPCFEEQFSDAQVPAFKAPPVRVRHVLALGGTD